MNDSLDDIEQAEQALHKIKTTKANKRDNQIRDLILKSISSSLISIAKNLSKLTDKLDD